MQLKDVFTPVETEPGQSLRERDGAWGEVITESVGHPRRKGRERTSQTLVALPRPRGTLGGGPWVVAPKQLVVTPRPHSGGDRLGQFRLGGQGC